MLIAQGRNVVFVSRQMGHANPQITLKIYAHEWSLHEQGEAMAQGLESEFGALV